MLDFLLSIDRACFIFINNSLSNPICDFIMPLFDDTRYLIPIMLFPFLFAVIFDKKNRWKLALLIPLAIILVDQSGLFIKKTILSRKKYNKFFNGYIGFFSYELCCELIGVKIPNQQSNNFYKSIFYKPQTVIKIRKNINIQSILSNFKSLDNLKKSKKKYVNVVAQK